MSAAERAYPRTAVGCMEIKTLPAATLIASRSEAKYFDRNNGLFMPLFRYIQSNDIAMTTPVESEISPGVMYFHIGKATASERLINTPSVSIHLMAERHVASIGLRGSYSAENFKTGEQQLAAWLAIHPNYQRAGAARGVFWNSPFMPALFKRSEIHIPVTKIASTAPYN